MEVMLKTTHKKPSITAMNGSNGISCHENTPYAFPHVYPIFHFVLGKRNTICIEDKKRWLQ